MDSEKAETFLEAIHLGKVRTMKCLLEWLAAGANPNESTRLGDTAFMRAARDFAPEAVQAMLTAGADPTLTTYRGESAVHFAAMGQTTGHIIRMLVTAGGNPNGRGFKGQTPLHVAAMYSKDTECSVVAALLDLGADAMALDDDGKTPAQVSETPEAAEMIRRHAEAKVLMSSTSEPKSPTRKRRLSNND